MVTVNKNISVTVTVHETFQLQLQLRVMKTFELQLIFGNNCQTKFSRCCQHAILHLHSILPFP